MFKCNNKINFILLTDLVYAHCTIAVIYDRYCTIESCILWILKMEIVEIYWRIDQGDRWCVIFATSPIGDLGAFADRWSGDRNTHFMQWPCHFRQKAVKYRLIVGVCFGTAIAYMLIFFNFLIGMIYAMGLFILLAWIMYILSWHDICFYFIGMINVYTINLF